jgi:tetratricopeptide (TPR) repeat protein
VDAACSDNVVPLEIPGNDKEQRDVLLKQANACLHAGKTPRAIALLSQIIRSNPADAETYVNRGTLQASIGEVPLALSDFTAAISLQPDLVEAWYNRGTTLTHMRRFESQSPISPRSSD